MALFKTQHAAPAPVDGKLTLGGRLELEVFVRVAPAARSSHGPQRVRADVVAYFVVPKVARALRYEVVAEGFDDPGYYGRHFATSFTPESTVRGRPHPTGFGDTAVRERGDGYWIALSAASSWVDCFAADWATLQSRFAGATVTTTVTLA
jgi:hypothetical protein